MPHLLDRRQNLRALFHLFESPKYVYIYITYKPIDFSVQNAHTRLDLNRQQADIP